MKSNSKIEDLMKKFNYLKNDEKKKNEYVFDDLLANENADYYEKCGKIIEELKSFFEIFSSM